MQLWIWPFQELGLQQRTAIRVIQPHVSPLQPLQLIPLTPQRCPFPCCGMAPSHFCPNGAAWQSGGMEERTFFVLPGHGNGALLSGGTVTLGWWGPHATVERHTGRRLLGCWPWSSPCGSHAQAPCDPVQQTPGVTRHGMPDMGTAVILLTKGTPAELHFPLQPCHITPVHVVIPPT